MIWTKLIYESNRACIKSCGRRVLVQLTTIEFVAVIPAVVITITSPWSVDAPTRITLKTGRFGILPKNNSDVAEWFQSQKVLHNVSIITIQCIHFCLPIALFYQFSSFSLSNMGVWGFLNSLFLTVPYFSPPEIPIHWRGLIVSLHHCGAVA